MEKFDIVNSDDESEEKGLLSGEMNCLVIQVTVVFGEVTSLKVLFITMATDIEYSNKTVTIYRVIG